MTPNAVSGILSAASAEERSFTGTDDSCPYSTSLAFPIEFRGNYFKKIFVSMAANMSLTLYETITCYSYDDVSRVK